MKFQVNTLLLCLACFVTTQLFAAPDEDKLVVLPAFDVKGTRPWLYAEVPGFQILSLTSEKNTRTILERFQRAARFAPLFFPPGYRTDFTARSTLFLHHFAGEKTIDDATRRLQLSYKPTAFTVSAGDMFVEFPSPERVADWLSHRQSPSPFFSIAELATPRIPVWYQEGLHILLSAAKVSDTALQTNPLSWKGVVTLPVAQVLALSTPEQLLAFNRAQPAQVSSFRMGAALFVHWAFFGNSGSRQAALLSFVAASAQKPADEVLVRKYFGIGFDELQTVLSDYQRKQISRSVRLSLPPTLARQPLAPVIVRPATQEQVATIVAESYLLLGDADPDNRDRYRTRARTLLTTLHRSGNQDPRLLALLGLLDFGDGKWADAHRELEAATSQNVAMPRAYTALARLRLLMTLRDSNDVPSLTVDQARDILQPALHALTLQPVTADTLALLQEVWLKQLVKPDTPDLQRFTGAVHTFPRNIPLLANAVAIEINAQRFDAARNLLSVALGWPELDPGIRATLETVRHQIEGR